MARRSSDLARIFTFGGRVPASIGFILAVMLAASILGWTNRSFLGAAALMPIAIRHGELWRLVTWPFFQDDPFTLLFAGFMLWTLGQQLSYAWSERRFVMRFLGYALWAGVVTTLLSFVWENATVIAHLGAWPVVNALLVAWAMLYPDRQVNLWGVLPLTGKTLALLVAFGTVLYAIASGLAAFTPHLVAIGIAWIQSRGLGGPRIGSQARRWWADREAKRRAKHLKVVRKDGSDDRPRWLN